MMRTSFLLLLLLAPLASAIGDPGTLNLYIWSEYIDPQVVKQFEKEHDAHVNIDVFEDAESMLAKIQGGGDALYDIVVPPDHLVRAMIKLKLLSRLPHEHLPNIGNLDPKFMNLPHDPGNIYTVPYQWGTVGIYARTNPGTALSRSWGLLFEPKVQPDSFVLIDSVRDMLGAALKYRGHSINSTNPPELKEARQLVLQAKSKALSFEGSVAGKNRVLARTARAAIVYSGEGARGMQEDPGTVYFIPEEGSQVWVDNLAITARAPHRALAEQFINYILDARVGARISNFNQFSTPNMASKPHIRPEDLANPTIYPPESMMKKLEFLSDLGMGNRLYDEIWTQIKSR
ncbi:MAG: spermidine/putrescine ABC transporter substrate-binding protein [Verrucomicrobia bacterium]|jgi:spermidine/putrescine transport system substrate-binding protein|nr:spermidine/putrescine ABC transporter substrate-binding protein [Verrucomicrobiota bacterium]